MMDTHSPLPWSIDDDGNITDADGFFVFEFSERNTHLIVTAVNAHANLLAAAKAVLGTVKDEEYRFKLKAVIKKAEGVTS
jgi:uncharacterized protein YhbP (UPF0306 family)